MSPAVVDQAPRIEQTVARADGRLGPVGTPR